MRAADADNRAPASAVAAVRLVFAELDITMERLSREGVKLSAACAGTTAKGQANINFDDRSRSRYHLSNGDRPEARV
jgi:hypothetical protein